jgi:hypothetical protein
MFFNLRANFRLYELLPFANRSLFPTPLLGSNGKLIFVLRVFALRAVLEKRIKLVNRGTTVYETQLLGPQYIEELDSNFTKEEIRESILKTKNNKATGFDGITAEMWKMFCIMKGGELKF